MKTSLLLNTLQQGTLLGYFETAQNTERPYTERYIAVLLGSGYLSCLMDQNLIQPEHFLALGHELRQLTQEG
ncbi:hypothetical protein ACVA51_15000 [Pseudomonas luteola]|nr:hypothetical protein [Pseudomonas luteola]